MSYRIEIGVDPDEGLYLELAFRNTLTLGLMSGVGIDFRLNVYGFVRDYGRYGLYGVTVASTSNGMIVEAFPGIQCINVPTCALLFGGQFIPAEPPPPPPLAAIPGLPPAPPYQGVPLSPPYAPFFPVDLKRSLRAKLLAVPLANPAFTKTLATLVISLGGSMAPRLTLDAYPLYPNIPTALGSCGVAQMKVQLALDGLFDTVQDALTGGATDPAVLTWNSGGEMSLTGPLANAIAAATNKSPAQMGAYFVTASQNIV